MISTYNNECKEKRIEMIWLGLSYCGKTSEEVAIGMKTSLQLWFGDKHKSLDGSCVDSGGQSTLKRLASGWRWYYHILRIILAVYTIHSHVSGCRYRNVSELVVSIKKMQSNFFIQSIPYTVN